MSVGAHEELLARCEGLQIQRSHALLQVVDRGFAIMRLIASIANADPYVLNENISRIIHRYSTGVASLPLVLHEFVTAYLAATSEHASAVYDIGDTADP
jgi:hypothetical protein